MPRQLLEHLNHELRSPMTVVVGMTDLLLLAPPDDERKNCLESVRQASDGLLLLLDEVIDFSRLEAGVLKLTAADFSLAEVADQASALLKRSAGSKTSFTLSIADGVPERMTGDPGRLAQMIAGLVRSAAKLRSVKSLELRVSAQPAANENVRLHFALGDAEANFQAEGAAAEPGEWLTLDYFRQQGYRGAGLSLPVTAALAGLMGGELWIASDAAYPVVFRLTCLVGRPAGVARPDLLSAIEQQLDAAPSASWHVLLAEDTRANQQFFRKVLEGRGHSVVAVANGREAIEAFVSQSAIRPFDVVLLDLEMPVMDGRQAVVALRESAAFVNHPAAVIALTAHHAGSNSSASTASGFDAVITKPCDLDSFFRVIDSAVRHAPPPAADSRATSAGSCVVDYRSALARLGGNEQLLGDLATFFLEDAPGILSALAGAIAAGDAAKIERAAHSLKGLAANFGAPAAVQAAAELQEAARRGELGRAQSLSEVLTRELERLASELRTLHHVAATSRKEEEGAP